MHNVPVQQLSRYYQSHQVPSNNWTALVMWYTCHKLTRIKILYKFWLIHEKINQKQIANEMVATQIVLLSNTNNKHKNLK